MDAIDVATIGTSGILRRGGMALARAAGRRWLGREVAEEAGERIARKGLREVAESATQKGGREIAEEIAEKTTREAVEEVVEYEYHHTIPNQIKRMLPDDIRYHKDIRGRKGLPNKIRIPKTIHKQIHSGPGRGGYYNERFIEEIKRRGGIHDMNVEKILQIRDDLVKEFNLGRFRK